MNFNARLALRRSWVWRAIVGPIYYRRQTLDWTRAGRPTPPPNSTKIRNLLTLADLFDIDVMIETGTFHGDTLEATAPRFKQVFSIEIFPPLAEAAKKRFANRPHVTIVQGDSASMLPGVMAKIDQPILFWLDGHYSGQGTGTAEIKSPVLSEIDHIVNLRQGKGDVIVIDDARCFTGEDGYPAMAPFLNDLEKKFGTRPLLANDAIFVLPRR